MERFRVIGMCIKPNINHCPNELAPTVRQRRCFAWLQTMTAVVFLCCSTTCFGELELILVQGAGGNAEYEAEFDRMTIQWQAISERMNAKIHIITPTANASSGETCFDALKAATLALSADEQSAAWLVLNGHGTYFNDEAKFNLVGPDFSAKQLAEWIAPLKRPVAIINTASCSGVFIDRLSGENRVVVTATKSGSEQNVTRFGSRFVQAVGNLESDIDHDGTISLLEAFLMASRETQRFYSEQGRLATEHALVDDNADRAGTSADFFRGIRQQANSTDTARRVDGGKAHQWIVYRHTDEPQLSEPSLHRRNELEVEIDQLRGQKDTLDQEEYYRRLETLAIELANLYP